jgi:hypothetical protein
VAAVVLAVFALMVLVQSSRAQKSGGAVQPAIPKTWDDEAMASLEVPLADSVGSPKHVSADYYYRIPVRAIYKSYPMYAPGREPSGYRDWLKQQQPEIIWDDRGRTPPLKTQPDWIKAGEIVFLAPFPEAPLPPDDVVRAWYQYVGPPVAKDGTIPFIRYIIRKTGEVEVGGDACAMCHTRVMPEGTILKGAQGNFPFDRSFTFTRIRAAAAAKDVGQFLDGLRAFFRALFAVPWLRPDPQARLQQMSIQELVSLYEAIPPSVNDRHRTSPFYPVQVPDLIGVKDRHTWIAPAFSSIARLWT